MKLRLRDVFPNICASCVLYDVTTQNVIPTHIPTSALLDCYITSIDTDNNRVAIFLDAHETLTSRFELVSDEDEFDEEQLEDDLAEMYACDFSGFCSGPSCSRYFSHCHPIES